MRLQSKGFALRCHKVEGDTIQRKIMLRGDESEYLFLKFKFDVDEEGHVAVRMIPG